MYPKDTSVPRLTEIEQARLDQWVRSIDRQHLNPWSAWCIAWIVFLCEAGAPDNIDRLLAVCEDEMTIAEMAQAWAAIKAKLRRLVTSNLTQPDSDDGSMPCTPFSH